MNPDKQLFLRSHIKVPMLVSDFSSMAGSTAVNLISGQNELIPYVAVLCVGPPCTSKSTLNSRRSENASCIQEGSSATGKGFKATFDFLQSHLPDVVVIENVVGVQQEGEEDFVLAQLKGMGYWTRTLLFNADTYGSAASRLRWYCVALRVQETSVEKSLGPRMESMHGQLMTALAISPFEAERFVVLDEDDLAWVSQKLGFFPRPHATRRDDQDCSYKDD